MSDINTQTHIYSDIEKYVQIGCVYGNVYLQKDKVFPQILTDYPKLDFDNLLKREEELIELNGLINDTQVVAVFGFGGIGKTTFAELYRETYKSKYEHIVWISCISDKFDSSSVSRFFYNKKLLDNLGIILENPTNLDENFYDEMLGIIINRLNEIKENNLLIIDNADRNIFNISDKLTLNSNWKILITTRENLSLKFKSYELKFLSLEQARQLFYLYYEQEKNDELVNEIVQLVGLHTLTIELLAKTAENSYRSLEEIKGLLIKKGLKIEDVTVETAFNKVKTETYIFECLKAAFAMVTGLQGSVRNCLLQFSVLPSSYISFDELRDFLKITDDERNKFATDLKYLENRGLISKQGNSFKCHQVLQEVIREQLKPTTEDCKSLIDSLIAKLEYDPIANAVEKAKYLPFAESVLHCINEENLQLAALAHNMNDVYDTIGEYQKAIECELKAIAIREKLAINSLDLAQSYNNIGVSYERQKKLKESLKYHRASLKVRKKLLDKHHSDIAQSLSGIAEVYSNSNINRAMKLYAASLNIWIRQSNKDKKLLSNIARTYNNLGMCLSFIKDYKAAEQLLNQSLEIKKSIYSRNHPEVIYSMINLGTLLFMQEKYTNALFLYENILEAQQSLYQNNHLFIIDTQKSLEIIRDKIKQIKISITK